MVGDKAMFDFSFKKNTFLGIDIGTASIKIVEIRMIDGKPVLSNYAWMPLGGNGSAKKDLDSEYFYATLPICIKKMIKKAKISGKDAYISLPSFGGLITLIDFPEMADGDMEQAIKFEAHKYIPTSLDDVVISWDVVEKREAAKSPGLSGVETRGLPGATVKVLLVAASKSKILKYENLIKTSGLTLRSVDIETFSIIRALLGNDPGSFIIIDIGSKACNIILVEKGVIRINRNIDAGGLDLTRAIAKEMQIDVERAEALKVSGKNFFTSAAPTSFVTLEVITGEVERIIRTYFKEEGREKVTEIILSGGMANMVGLADYFSDKLKIKTVVGDPFARITYDKKAEKLVSRIRTSFAVAVGSALKGVEEFSKKAVK
ncbi:MAG: type IV pilus assembly protein PilM [Candidatus Moranbacteria bacterium]|nr:type IV pilus assembly protein PilM [Candidatus Moranbacteria bacterium]